jgi:hypothetical protein
MSLQGTPPEKSRNGQMAARQFSLLLPALHFALFITRALASVDPNFQEAVKATLNR